MLLRKRTSAMIVMNLDDTDHIPVTFVFNPDMPIEVRMLFHYDDNDDGQGDTVEWVFARDLLNYGMEAPSGMSDVVVWPEDSYLVIQLTGRHVLTLVEYTVKCRFSYDTVLAFLTESYALVSRANEESCVNVDHAINKILQAKW